MLPAVDVGRSVSRVGGKTQLPAYRRVAGDLRLSYSQFEELEAFSRFSSRLDEETRQTLERGHRVREVLKQPQGKPLSAPEQVAVLVAVTAGVFDALPVAQIAEAETSVRRSVLANCPELCARIEAGEKLTDEDFQTLQETTRESVTQLLEKNHAHAGKPGTADSLG
jgi:F-type H+-transporting ATPase subunit alpha